MGGHTNAVGLAEVDDVLLLQVGVALVLQYSGLVLLDAVEDLTALRNVEVGNACKHAVMCPGQRECV